MVRAHGLTEVWVLIGGGGTPRAEVSEDEPALGGVSCGLLPGFQLLSVGENTEGISVD